MRLTTPVTPVVLDLKSMRADFDREEYDRRVREQARQYEAEQARKAKESRP